MRSNPHARTTLLALATLLACSSGGAPSTVAPIGTTPATPPAPTTWKLAWSDEFDGASGAPVDAAKWGHDLGDGCSSGICGWGNNEKEFYTNAPENVSLDGQGHLQIVARQAPSGLTCYYGACRYTSGKITTRGKMTATPGRVEARLKLPAGQGLWPAFWMLGSGFPSVAWPACGELDIMENKGSAPSATSSAIHGPGYSGNTPFARVSQLPGGGVTSDFHTYAVEWDAETVQFSVDSVLHYTVSQTDLLQYGNPVLGNSYFVILDLAVGGQFDGDPRSDAIFPATMLVDWVRVYSK
ncbi:MAG: family 16 glycosylhydrolase [Gemmatimonadaceae bacterium]